jgi:hypothetical protein
MYVEYLNNTFMHLCKDFSVHLRYLEKLKNGASRRGNIIDSFRFSRPGLRLKTDPTERKIADIKLHTHYTYAQHRRHALVRFDLRKISSFSFFLSFARFVHV